MSSEKDFESLVDGMVSGALCDAFELGRRMGYLQGRLDVAPSVVGGEVLELKSGPPARPEKPGHNEVSALIRERIVTLMATDSAVGARIYRAAAAYTGDWMGLEGYAIEEAGKIISAWLKKAVERLAGTESPGEAEEQ